MHQPLEGDEEYKKARQEYLERLNNLWDEVLEQSVSDDEIRQRMDALKWEQQRLEMLKKQTAKAPSPWAVAPNPFVVAETGSHKMNFKCQCKRCVRLHTITMQDAKFLKSLGIVWSNKNESKTNSD